MLKKLICFAAFPMLVGGIVSLWIFYGGWAAISCPTSNNKFESMNVLFSGLAFLAMVVAIYLQMAELKDTREELKKSAEANEATAQNLMLQARLNYLLVQYKHLYPEYMEIGTQYAQNNCCDADKLDIDDQFSHIESRFKKIKHEIDELTKSNTKLQK